MSEYLECFGEMPKRQSIFLFLCTVFFKPEPESVHERSIARRALAMMAWNRKFKSFVCEMVICPKLAFLGEGNLNAPCLQ